MPTASLRKKLQQPRPDVSKKKKSWRSSAYVSSRSVLLTVRVRSMPFVLNAPSRKVSVRPAERRKRRPNCNVNKPRSLTLPAESNLLRKRC